MPKKIFYLGVEGGATKSMAILSSDDREIILTKKGGALNYHNTGESGTKNNLSKLIFPLSFFILTGKRLDTMIILFDIL